MAVLFGGALIFSVACDARTSLDSEYEPTTPEEECSLGGGEWLGGDCGGRMDYCGLVTCETVIGQGCWCNVDDECWDPAEKECRPFSRR